MNLRNLFRVVGIIMGLGGLSWLLSPQSMTGAAGYTIDPFATYFLRALGANSVAFAVLAFLISGMGPSPARQAVVITFIVLMAVSFLVNLMAALSSPLPPGVAWFSAAFNLVFGLAFAYLGFIRREESPTPELQS